VRTRGGRREAREGEEEKGKEGPVASTRTLEYARGSAASGPCGQD
jgi:hypothetical protein